MYLEAARPPHYTKRPPEQQQDHTTAEAKGKPTTPTHIYKENADHQQHHFEKPPFGSQPGGSWSRESVLKPPGRKNAPTKCSTALPPEKHFFQFRGRPVDANLADFVKNRPYFKRCCLFFRFWSFGLLLLFRSVVWASRSCCACAFVSGRLASLLLFRSVVWASRSCCACAFVSGRLASLLLFRSVVWASRSCCACAFVSGLLAHCCRFGRGYAYVYIYTYMYIYTYI